jgi:predicted nucleic acid-binding protein
MPGTNNDGPCDASLIWLAHETGLREIMTTDANDFNRYRLPDGGALRLL